MLDKRERECFICAKSMPVRSGGEIKMGGKKRFVCEVCRLTTCQPLPKGRIDTPPAK